MAQTSFSSDWLNLLSDPYAVLGLSVAADDRRVLKRYRSVAKLLHPDGFAAADAATKQLASQLFARLINPAYQKLKQEKERAESLAALRLHIRQMNRDEPLQPRSALAHQLLQAPTQEVEVFYEQAIDRLSERQFQPIEQPFDQFASIAQQLSELNLVYLYLKTSEPVIREKRTGLVSATEAKSFTPPSVETIQTVTSYAQRHYRRAQVHIQQSNLPQAVAELRDAIRLENDKSEYHALLSKVYLMQNLPGMAKVHCRQALKLNPQDPLALQYAARLNLPIDSPAQPSKAQSGEQKSPAKPNGSNTSFFGLFAKKR
jgi:curved DNA-binding protein CbpA